ncbi:MAG: prepilin-type N-terminal cleavage/methylation domain-containing protein [Candidatus Omnitrophica bacterium]|nr:prepilin-type N-terminal cleavage/methylation domain-containing protein [Candidatus Omnitrophota bacterium]
MCNQRSKQAITLVEILVATVIASMVLFGALLSTTALQKSANDFGGSYVNKAQSSEVLDHMLRNASLAMGSDMGPAFDKGILIGADETGDANTFCIHQDVDALGVANQTSTGESTAKDTSDDHWLCYTLATSEDTKGVYYCYKDYVASGACPTCRGAGACKVGLSGTRFLGSMSSWMPTFTLKGRQLLFSIHMTSRLKSTSTEKTSDGSNPETTVSGSVTPAVHSFSMQ